MYVPTTPNLYWKPKWLCEWVLSTSNNAHCFGYSIFNFIKRYYWIGFWYLLHLWLIITIVTFGLKWMNWSFIYPRKWILQLCLIIIIIFIIIMKWKKMAFHEWLNSERLMKSPIVTGNLFSVGKIPTTPEIKRLRKRRWHRKCSRSGGIPIRWNNNI